MCYIVHSICSYCNVVFSYYTCYNIVQFVVHIGYYIAHCSDCTLPSCAGARLLHQAESLSPACCAGARAAVARLLCQAASAESPRARSAAMLCQPKSLECALIFNCCCLLRRRPPGVNEARRRRAPLPWPLGGASSLSPPWSGASSSAKGSTKSSMFAKKFWPPSTTPSAGPQLDSSSWMA